MESESGRSSKVSERHHSMVEARTTPISHIFRPRSAVDLILYRIGAVHADTREFIVAMQANMGAIHADTKESIEAIHANLGAVGAVQVGNREVLETVIHRLERLEASPVPKFVVQGWTIRLRTFRLRH